MLQTFILSFWPKSHRDYNTHLFQIAFTPAYYYNFDREDIRRDISSALFRYSGQDGVQRLISTEMGFRLTKWRRMWLQPSMGGDMASVLKTGVNWPLLRYSDVLLMIAEAENEINAAPTKEAYDCLNEVRRRAGIVEYTEGSLSKEQFRQAVKDERGMELCFEYTRRFDLIRWGEYITNMNALVSRAEQGLNWTNGNGTYGVSNYFNITSAYNYFPIPDSEMSVNNAITTNNPGW